jgi:hypothetical protein
MNEEILHHKTPAFFLNIDNEIIKVILNIIILIIFNGYSILLLNIIFPYNK